MATGASTGYAGVKKMASGLEGLQRDSWLRRVKACYELTGKSGFEKFAKKWLGGEFRDGFFSLRKLQTYGILHQVGESVRRGRRAYWRMPDREGVEKALEEFGYL